MTKHWRLILFIALVFAIAASGAYIPNGLRDLDRPSGTANISGG
jgi:hypothetical protein